MTSASALATQKPGLPRRDAPRNDEGVMDCHVAARLAMTGVEAFRYDAYMRTQPAIYILASGKNATLYVGVTSNLIQRVWQHQNNMVQGFTQKHNVHTLVYFELHATMHDAISREKQLKAGSRAKKVALVEAQNSAWIDLYPGLL